MILMQLLFMISHLIVHFFRTLMLNSFNQHSSKFIRQEAQLINHPVHALMQIIRQVTSGYHFHLLKCFHSAHFLFQ